MLQKFNSFYQNHKLECSIIAAGLAVIIAITCLILILPDASQTETGNDSSAPIVLPDSSVIESSSENPSSSEVSSSTSLDTSSKQPVASMPESTAPTYLPNYDNGGFYYNTNLDIEDNVFLDSMVYTGYNLEKHRADGLMWKYVLSKYKKGYGWLSKISYDYDGGTSGYEVNAQGKPDIAYFEKHDLVCASYVTYVYFNYLPNVAGIDTSMLTKPYNPTLANDWYRAALDWVEKGYSYEIEFDAYRNGGGEIQFKPKQEIPIGSIVLCNDMNNKSSNWACHVSIYAGYKDGYHWVYHVGNDNGPEFCAMERFCYGPDPVWPLAVISTPTNIRFSAAIDVEVKDENGKAVEGAEISLKNVKTGKVTNLGKTDSKGKVSGEKLDYGEYEITQTVPSGYTCSTATQTVSLLTQNNSLTKFTFKNKKS